VPVYSYTHWSVF